MNNDVVTLFSRDGTEKIVCFKYMEECYLKQGYISSHNIYINLLSIHYKFFYLKKKQFIFIK